MVIKSQCFFLSCRSPRLLLLDDLGLLERLLQELGNAGADLLDLLDEILRVVGEELGSGSELVLDLLSLMG